MGDDQSKEAIDEIEVEKQTELMYQENTIWTAIFSADKTKIEGMIDADPTLINIRGAVGECLIHMLFLCGSVKHLEIACNLLERFSFIVTQIYNKPRYYGENILHLAIVKQNAVMVEWLLSNEHLLSYRDDLLTAAATGYFFRIGKPSYYGETPLGFACCTKQWDIVEILLKYGANMDITDSNGNTILHMLVIRNLPDIYAKYKARWIEQQAIIRASRSIADKTEPLDLWNRLNNDDLTPLTLAADLGRISMLSWLLEERKKVQWSYGDVSCILHPLDQLDLDFDKKMARKPLSVIEIIVKNNDPNCVHPIIISLIDKKWKYFAYRILIRRFCVTFLYLMVFLGTTILEQSRVETVRQKGDHSSAPYASLSQRLICFLGHIIVTAGALWKAYGEINEMADMGLGNYLRTSGSIFLENCLACAFCTCIIIFEYRRWFVRENETVILAIASLLGWGYMFFFIMPFRFTGPFVIMIYKMLFNDVLRFCMIYTIFLAGFAQSFFILFNENGFEGYSSSIKQCFLGLLGDFDLDRHIDGPHPTASVILLILYVVVISILLLNLLIAMMGDTYQDVKKSAKKLWHLERARIALDVENNMSTEARQLIANKYWVDVKKKRYLQVEEVDNELFDRKEDQADE